MSIQFRSRIKPAIDYTNDLNAFGTCCSLTEGPRAESFYGCFASGGQFIAEPWNGTQVGQCPSTDTRLGCCCACSYVSDTEYDLLEPYPPTNPYLLSGTQSNVSKCECDRLKGKWTDEECQPLNSNNWERYCVSGTNESTEIDVRYPKACCHLGFDSETGWPIGATCSDVCSYGDCVLKNTEDYTSVYDDTKRCSIPLREADLTMPCSSTSNFSKMATKSTSYSNSAIGSCYDLEDVGGNSEYNCTLTPATLCDGYWVGEQDSDNAFCVSKYQPSNPNKSSGIYQVETMTQAAFNALGLSAGDNYQGGVFIGIFEPTPNNPTSSLVMGNINFRTPSVTKFYGDTVGNTTHKKWAIIVNTDHYYGRFLLEGESDVTYNTSMWDGYYNTYGQVGKFDGFQNKFGIDLRWKKLRGFIDWYLPSIYELNFYSLYLHEISGGSDYGIVMSSSMFSSDKLNSTTNKTKLINNHSFLYSQQCAVVDSTLKDTYRVGLADKESLHFFKIFRKIVIT